MRDWPVVLVLTRGLLLGYRDPHCRTCIGRLCFRSSLWATVVSDLKGSGDPQRCTPLALLYGQYSA